MNTFLHDDSELDALLKQADPLDEAQVRTVAGSASAIALRDAVIKNRSGRRLLRPAVLAAAAVAVVATATSIALVKPSLSGSAYGAELVRFAKHSPQLLVGAPGWHVTRADEEDSKTGEMTFASGTRSMDLFWVPGAHEKDSDKFDLTRLGTATIHGARAWVGTYGNGEFEAIWSEGDRALDARGTFASKGAFLAVATTLHRVDVDSWLAAMPASVVKPDSRAAVVAHMLADIPQPRGFDASTLTNSGNVADRYQLGAAVTGAVSCAWVHQWSHGDAAARRQAATAMASSHHWAILHEMDPAGAWSEEIWDVADYLAGTHGSSTGRIARQLRLGGVTLEQWAKSALGC